MYTTEPVVTGITTALDMTDQSNEMHPVTLSGSYSTDSFNVTTQNKMVVTESQVSSTRTTTGMATCEGWNAPISGDSFYFCVDEHPVESHDSMEAACNSVESGSTYAIAPDYDEAYKIFTLIKDDLPPYEQSAADPSGGAFKIGESAGSNCFYFFGDSGDDGDFALAQDCDLPGRTICLGGAVDTTTLKVETTPLLWTTPSFDSVLADLGVNDSDFESLLGAVDDVLTGNGTLSAGALFSYSFAMKQATSEDATADELGGAVDTCSKLFDKVGGASKAEMTNIANNVLGVIGSAFETASAPTNGSSNSSQSAEDLVSSTQKLIDKIGVAVAGTLSTSDSPVVLETDSIGNTSLTAGSVSITLEDNPGLSDLPLQVSSFSSDPYSSFSTNTDGFESGAAPLSMKVPGNDSASVNFKAASKANFSIERESESIPAEGVTKTYTFTTLYSFMKIFLTIPGEPSVYTVRCSFDEPHNETDPFLEAHITDELNVTLNTYNVSVTYSNDTDEMSIFLKATDLGLGTVYVHTSTDQVNGTRTKRSTGSQLSAGAAVYSPRVWNETAKAWVPAPDVEIDPDSSGEQVVFKSNFMGSITSDIVTPPNTIDFDTVFDDIGAKTRENPYVLILVCLLAGLYLILLIPIRRLDIRDYKQWEFLPILHNRPEDKYIYQISVAIGSKSSQQFDTEVFCCLYGEKGKTTPKTLEDGKRKNFVPGRPANFTVTCKEDIGGITHIHIWTRARDERDSLFVEWITVADPERQLTYTFLCNDWISPVQSLCYGHEIFTKDMEEGKDFVGLVKSNTKNKIFDDHLWLSVVKRPNKSNFSRVQRWSMCVSTMFLTMVVNAMWFPTEPVDNPDTSATISIGPIDLSFKTFSIAIMGSMIVIPPNLLIMLFFRRSRPFVPHGRRRKVEHERVSTEALPLKTDQVQKVDEPMFKEGEALSQNGDGAAGYGNAGYGAADDDATGHGAAGTCTQEVDSSNSKAHSGSYSIGNLKLLPTSSVDLNIPPPPKYEPPRYMKSKKNHKVEDKYIITDEMEAELKELEWKNNRPFSFPWWGVIFGYILCGVCVANGVWWPYLYSIQWGKELSLEWLASLVLSLFQSILIMQPIKVIIIAVIAAFLLQDSAPEPEDASLINTVSSLHGQVRPVESREPPVRPQNIEVPDLTNTLSEARLHQKLFAKLKGTLAHLLYLALLIAVVSHNSDGHFYYQNKAVKDSFELNDIELSRIEEIYPWLKESIFPNIYPFYAYNGDVLSEEEQRYIANMDGYLLGPVRMKQNRDIAVECDELKKAEMGRLMKVYECKAKEDTENWNARWNGTYVEGNLMYPEHMYEETKGGYNGKLFRYKLGGYSANMFKWSWEAILDQFESNAWIDKQTRAVFVEFVINNANVNVFTQVKIVLETPVYGGVFASYKVNSFRPYPYVTPWDFVFLVIQCIWFLLLCYIMVKEGMALRKEGLLAYVKDAWHWVEVFNALFAFTSCVFFALRSMEVVNAVELMYNNRGEYVDFEKVTQWDTLYSLFIALVLFIAILQLYQPMDFSRQLTGLKASLSYTGATIAWYTVIIFLFLLLYSHILTIAFGSEFGAFVEFFRSFYYLFGMLLGILKYTDLIESDSAILRILFAVYMVVGNFIILNLFLSVINDGLAYMQENPDEVAFDEELVNYMQRKLGAWYTSLRGAKEGHAKDLAKVRRGGPWNRELELYYSLLEDHQVTPIEDKQAEEHQSNVNEKADRAIDLFSMASDNKLSEAEKRSMTQCEQHDRNEHTVRAAIKTIIWDMLLSNDKANDFINSSHKKEPAQKARPETPQEEIHCLNETSGRIGPEGGRIEVLPGTWIVIDRGTFSFPTYIRVQAYTTNLFASHVIQLESERPLAKPFKCSLPFKDGKKRDYCNVFVQRDDGPWTLTYNSVTCFSESLRCMCHPKDEERKYRIAAKATPKKSVAKAGHTLDSKITVGAVLKAAAGDGDRAETIKEEIDEHIAEEMAAKWKQITEEKDQVRNQVANELEEGKEITDEECVNSKSNLDLL